MKIHHSHLDYNPPLSHYFVIFVSCAIELNFDQPIWTPTFCNHLPFSSSPSKLLFACTTKKEKLFSMSKIIEHFLNVICVPFPMKLVSPFASLGSDAVSVGSTSITLLPLSFTHSETNRSYRQLLSCSLSVSLFAVTACIFLISLSILSQHAKPSPKLHFGWLSELNFICRFFFDCFIIFLFVWYAGIRSATNRMCNIRSTFFQGRARFCD